jgi:hypothetical protein
MTTVEQLINIKLLRLRNRTEERGDKNNMAAFADAPELVSSFSYRTSLHPSVSGGR